MTKEYVNVVKALSVSDKGGKCLVCGTVTQWATLSQYGGRCVSCFDAYCQGEGERIVAQTKHHYATIGEPDWRDTITQREMRAKVRGHIGNLRAPTLTRIEHVPPPTEDDAERTKQLKLDAARRVAEYARKTGQRL